MQAGTHGLIGIGLGKFLFPDDAETQRGLLLGSLAPDLDVIPAALLIAPLFGFQAAIASHRTWSHTIFILPALHGLFALPRLRRIDPGLRRGFLIGVACHIICDVLWIVPIALFWPLSEALGWQRVSVWWGTEIPLWLTRLLAAGEYLAWGLYLGTLHRMAILQGRGWRMLEVYQYLLFFIFALAGVLLNLDHGLFDMVAYAPASLFIFPSLCYVAYVLLEGEEERCRLQAQTSS